MDGSSVTNPDSPTANHKSGQNVLFYDGHATWKSVNTWANSAFPKDSSGNREPDNYFIHEYPNADGTFPDTDACMSRP
jgi:prepilin-type processing-associated H-X9-DG protein